MAQEPQFIPVSGPGGEPERAIAVLHDAGAVGRPGVLWLSGFKSDMAGTKALALAEWAKANDYACTRMDYSGHGASSGAFEDGSISMWAEEAWKVFEQFCQRPTVIVGSSMGGWIALLLARRLRRERQAAAGLMKGLVLIAPAPDFTQKLMWENEFTDEIREKIMRDGRFERPSDYDEPYVITRKLIEDGRENLLLDGELDLGCPVTILQGTKDDAVPWEHAVRLMECLSTSDTVLSLIKDGDHRLSTPADLDRLSAATRELLTR